MACKHKHTRPQILDDEWKCPECGNTDSFIVEESPNDDCPLLHDGDYCRCTACDYEASGKDVAKALGAKTKCCPTCGGTGRVAK